MTLSNHFLCSLLLSSESHNNKGLKETTIEPCSAILYSNTIPMYTYLNDHELSQIEPIE